MNNSYQSSYNAKSGVAEPSGKRPFSIWLLLLLLAVSTIAYAFGIGKGRSSLVAQPEGFNLSNWLGISRALALVSVPVGAAYWVARRRQWGRWLGVLALVAVTVMIYFVPDSTYYANDAQREGGAFGRTVVLPCLMLVWIYKSGFSRTAKRYFAG